jgi:hypothetical protein
MLSAYVLDRDEDLIDNHKSSMNLSKEVHHDSDVDIDKRDHLPNANDYWHPYAFCSATTSNLNCRVPSS